MLDSNAHTLITGSFSVYFHFSESRIFMTPAHKWHNKQTKIMFQITKFTVSDRIYPIQYSYIRIEDILWPRQILPAVKVRAIWWGKEPCSFRAHVMLNEQRRCIGRLCHIHVSQSFFFKCSLILFNSKRNVHGKVMYYKFIKRN